MSSRTTLAGRLRTTLLAVGLLQLLAVVAALTLAIETRADAARLNERYFATVQDSHEGFVRALDLEDALLNYLRSGDPELLAEVRRLQQPRRDGVTVEILRGRLSREPDALEALERVAGAYRTWLEQSTPVLEAVEQDGPQAVSLAQRRAVESGFNEVRTTYDAYVEEVLEARARAADALLLRTTLLFGAVVLAVGTAVVTGLVLYGALSRWVVRPLAALVAETRTVRSGALDHQVRVDGPPEIEELADDVEAMRRGLVEQLTALERSQQALQQQAEELRRSNRDLEQFAYVASHDLQEPLRKVSSFCQMLERRYKGQLDERADQYIAFAVDGAKRMQLLINDLLTFSRVGRLSEGFTEVPMDEVLADALRNLSTAVEDSGAVVTADPLPVVHGERRLLVQLLQNLLGNAVKFRGEEPPRIRVEARRTTRDDVPVWEFAVSDNGIGIEPQYAERIFVIFQRLHPKAEYEGTGIGLSLCKKIVEHHGGTIWLDETPGTGTTFRWTLPQQRQEAAEDVLGDATRFVEAALADRGSSGDEPAGEDDEAPEGADKEATWTTSR